MRIGQIIGSVTLGRVHTSLKSARFLLAVPSTLEDLRRGRLGSGEELVVLDELGAGVGSRVGISEGREAAMPFHPERKPVDAYSACILDRVTVTDP